MTMLARAFSWVMKGEFLSDTGNTTSPSQSLLGALGGRRTRSGMDVNRVTAMQATAVWACVQAISQDIAKVPAQLKRRLPSGDTEVVLDAPLARLLRKPNTWQTWNEYVQFQLVNRLLSGNSYAVIQRDGSNRLTGIVPVAANDVTIYEAAGQIYYDVHPSNTFVAGMIGGGRRFDRGEIHHVRGMSLNGIHGLSPVAYFRETIGLSLAQERHGAALFGNSAMPSGVLETDDALSEEAASRLKRSWNDAQSGVDNAGKTAVLESGVKWKPLAMSNEDAQYLESRRFSVSEIARIYRVPPHKVGDLERATFSNIEEQSLEYVTDCLMPHFEAIEAAMGRDLVSQPDQFIEFDVSRLLRGDIKSRIEAMGALWDRGVVNADEIRMKEGMNPMPDGLGATYWRPLNFVAVGSEPAQEGEE